VRGEALIDSRGGGFTFVAKEPGSFFLKMQLEDIPRVLVTGAKRTIDKKQAATNVASGRDPPDLSCESWVLKEGHGL
jgi:hypothetical protein